MKQSVSAILALASLSGCAACADALQPAQSVKAAATQVPLTAPPGPRRQSCERVMAEDPQTLIQALESTVISDRSGRPIARVDGFQSGPDGGIKMVGVQHGAEAGAGTVTVMVPFQKFACVSTGAESYKLVSAKPFKPHPEFKAVDRQ